MVTTEIAPDTRKGTPPAPPNFSQPLTLYAAFAAVILFIVLIAITGLFRLQDMRGSFEDVVKTREQRVDLALTISFTARERLPILYAMTFIEDPFEREEKLLEIFDLGQRFLKAREALIEQDLDATEISLLDNQRELAKEAIAIQRRMLALMDNGEMEKARELIPTHVKYAQDEALRPIDALIDYERLRAKEAFEKANESAETAARILVVLTVIAVNLSLFIAIMIIRRMNRNMRALNEARQTLEARVLERTEELERANRKLHFMANRDDLTGLPNRALFRETLPTFIARARRRNTEAALLFIDLDDFKRINDHFGHAMGDELLKEIARRLTGVLRDEDMVARIGGDEFVVLIGDLDSDKAARHVADKLISHLRQPFDLHGMESRISASVGIAIYPQNGTDTESLLAYADKDMYEDKKRRKETLKRIKGRAS